MLFTFLSLQPEIKCIASIIPAVACAASTGAVGTVVGGIVGIGRWCRALGIPSIIIVDIGVVIVGSGGSVVVANIVLNCRRS